MMTPPKESQMEQEPSTFDHADAAVLSGGGEMGALMRSIDWSKTPIGPVESWSPALRMMVSFLLVNRFPLLLWWGPQYVSIYNDAYRPVLGTKHPKALGQPAGECWNEIWHILQPLIDRPFYGGPATWMDDIFLEINRHGFVEETHFTIAYSPVPDVSVASGIGGVLATVHEITEKVVGERRLRVLRDLGARSTDAKTAEEACTIAAATLAQHPKDIPFALLYLIDSDRMQARLAGAAGVKIGDDASPRVIDLDNTSSKQLWPVAEIMRQEAAQIIEDLAKKVAGVPSGPWSDPPHCAVALPIPSNMAHRLVGVLVLGVSARLRLDDLYRSFFDLVTSQVATAIANARAYEEERKRAEALAEIDRAKTAFFSNVSHEFRTPLTLMLGPIEDALHGESLPDTERERLTVVHRNGVRLLKLVNTLLDFSRIEAGRMQAVYEPTNVSEYTAELASVFRSAVEQAGLQLIVDCQPLPETVYVDREMWEKIVLNLVSNAFKFTFEGQIVVSLKIDDTQARLKVCDTGTGIVPDELPRIFERFHRIRGARSRIYEGTGLVQELVTLHGGTVTVESAYGKGTTFTVSIPLGKAHLPEDRLSASGTQASTAIGAASYVAEALRWSASEEGSKFDIRGSTFGIDDSDSSNFEPRTMNHPRGRVLLVDDNADMREYVRRLLSPRYDVEAAADGQAALLRAHEQTPDLVLTDVMMPNLDGFGLLRELRADPRTRNIPIILLSARAGEEARVEGWEAGADDYLTKPFSARELMARVGTHLDMARLRAEWAERERAARRQSEQAEIRLREVLDTTSEGFMVLDREWRYTYINRQGADMARRLPEDLIGKIIWDAFPDAAGSQVQQEFERALRDQTAAHFETFYAPYGRWFEHHVYPSEERLSIFFRDVTARKEAERKIHLLNDELESKVRELEESKAALEEKNGDLEKFHDVVVGRELKMIEMEKELSKFKDQLK
ncbi:MAG: response regulator [Nitrospirota bacterium]|nr:response regulator [Nitrospirota bacterium]